MPRLSLSSPILPGQPIGNITKIEGTGNSSYNALWISATQRMTRGLQFNASYTWSKSIDYNSLSSGGVDRAEQLQSARATVALSDFDARHRFVVSSIYELPFKRNRLIAGWQLSAIVQAQSGNPINIVTSNSLVNGVANTLRPDVTGRSRLSGAWIDGSILPCLFPWIASAIWAAMSSPGRRSTTRISRISQDNGAWRAHAASVSNRVLRSVQPCELWPAGQHRGQPQFRPHHQHALSDRRIWLVPPAAIRSETLVLSAIRKKKMKRSRRTRWLYGLGLIHAFALLVCIVAFPLLATSAETPSQKRVLALYWYGKDFYSNIEFDRGIQTALRGVGVEYHAEYFEPNMFPGEGQAIALRDYLQRKYADRKIDVVIAMSAVSTDFVLKYRDSLFPDVPIVMHANSPAQLSERAAQTHSTTGVAPDNVHAHTLETALRLHPDTEHVYVINGTIEQDKSIEALLKERFSGIQSKAEITYLTDLSLDQLLRRVKSPPGPFARSFTAGRIMKTRAEVCL